MDLYGLMEILENYAPKALAEEWDNPGLLVEPAEADIQRVLVALDCTCEVVAEAAAKRAQLVLAHHPLFFKPVRSLYHSRPDTAAAYLLARHGIGMYAAHTNLDSAQNGVNDALARAVGLHDIRSLIYPALPLDSGSASVGRVGDLEEPQTLKSFAMRVRDVLHAAVRYGGAPESEVRRVAVVGGSGGDYLREAKAAGADVLITGEVRHDAALSAHMLGINVIEAGHYETERVVLEPWIAGLQKALDAVQYKVDLLLAESEKAPLVAP